MNSSNKLYINDSLKLPNEDDFKRFAEQIGISYEDYITALDAGKGFPLEELLAFVEKMHSE